MWLSRDHAASGAVRGSARPFRFWHAGTFFAFGRVA
jgi:hypothetical protein